MRREILAPIGRDACAFKLSFILLRFLRLTTKTAMNIGRSQRIGRIGSGQQDKAGTETALSYVPTARIHRFSDKWDP